MRNNIAVKAYVGTYRVLFRVFLFDSPRLILLLSLHHKPRCLILNNLYLLYLQLPISQYLSFTLQVNPLILRYSCVHSQVLIDYVLCCYLLALHNLLVYLKDLDNLWATLAYTIFNKIYLLLEFINWHILKFWSLKSCVVYQVCYHFGLQSVMLFPFVLRVNFSHILVSCNYYTKNDKWDIYSENSSCNVYKIEPNLISDFNIWYIISE